MPILCKTEMVTFRDGSSLTVSEVNWDISMKLSELEAWAEAEENQLDDPRKQLFREAFYPKLAACSTGDVPDEETARSLPSDELDKWYGAVRRINSGWFAGLDQLAELGVAVLEEQRKKKSKPPVKLSTG